MVGGQMMPPHGMGQGTPPGAQPNKTVLLQPSEGVVSMAQRGAGGLQGAAARQVVEGASTLYWVVCLFTGVAIGVLAYVVYPVSYTHLRAHETPEHLVCRLLL